MQQEATLPGEVTSCPVGPIARGLRVEAGLWQAGPWGLRREMLLLRGQGASVFHRQTQPDPSEGAPQPVGTTAGPGPGIDVE